MRGKEHLRFTAPNTWRLAEGRVLASLHELTLEHEGDHTYFRQEAILSHMREDWRSTSHYEYGSLTADDVQTLLSRYIDEGVVAVGNILGKSLQPTNKGYRTNLSVEDDLERALRDQESQP